jgi:phage terminase Nu1 subunit (DNA packaging protein)
VTFVIGEDHDYHARTREYQRLQKEFLDEQVEQKKLIKESQKLTHQQFDQQLLHNTHHRGQL